MFCKDLSMPEDVQGSTVSHIRLADGQCARVTCKVTLTFSSLGHSFQNVLCVPSLKNNLLSVGALTAEGFSLLFSPKGCSISKGEKALLQGKLQNSVYVVENSQAGAKVVTNKCVHDNCIHVLHKRFAHLGYETLRKTSSVAK